MNRVKSFCLPFAVFVLVLALGLWLASAASALASGQEGHETPGAKVEEMMDKTPTGEPAHGEGRGGEHGTPPEKWWDLLYRTVNFGVLFLVLFFVLKKPASRFFSNRRESIAQTLAEFEEKKAEAEVRFKELEEKVSSLEAEREKILAEYLREGEEEKDKIIANAHQMADRIKNQAETTINQEIKAAKEGLIQEIADMSASMAEDLIRKNINDQDQERLVKEYLDKVVQN